MKSLILLILTILGFQTALARQLSTVPDIGGHYPLFTFEKNENPQNILVLYTKLDNNCHVAEEAQVPVFDMYWLMDRLTYKPTNSMLKNSIKNRLQVIPTSESAGFYILINDLKEVNSDLQDPRLMVVADQQQGECIVRSLFTLGPSDKKATMQLTSIYSEATKTMGPPFRKLKSVTLNGINTLTGAKIRRRYLAK